MRYELRSELARGGMGVVYRVYDRLARREVAYKRLLREGKTSDAKRVALFEQEYNALAQLSHPNIVQVYEYGFDAKGPFYTMELLSGSDLYQRAPLSLHEACRVLRDVASALSLVHARRLVYRDISPLNVRLTEDGRAKLIDFGALSRVGRAMEVVGTPAFVAPECLSTHQLDARTDLFSLGALAYWLLTRKSAFPARSRRRTRETSPRRSTSWCSPCSTPTRRHVRAALPR
jgi:serine/threonine protein kinase